MNHLKEITICLFLLSSEPLKKFGIIIRSCLVCNNGNDKNWANQQEYEMK